MKSLFKATALFILFSLQACKKQDKSIRSGETSFSLTEKQQISNYLGSKKEKTGDSGKTAIDTILHQISWDQYYIAADDFGNKITVFALKNSLVNNMFVLLYSGKEDGIYKGAELAVVNNKDINVYSKLELLAKLYTNKEVLFTGSIEYYRITREFMYKQGYASGIKEYTAVRECRKKTSEVKNITEEETCYNVYLVTYWSDGSATYDFLYSYCVAPDCPDLRANGSLIISSGNIENVVECGGGSGGNGSGPGGTNGEIPPQPSEECMNNIISFAGSPVSQTISSTTVSSTPETIEKKYNWIFHQAATWHYHSTERGIRTKVNNEWRFTSLTHQSHAREGWVVGGTITLSSFNAHPTVGIYNAIMDLDYTIEASVVCTGSPLNLSFTYRAGKSFNSIH